MKDAKNFTARLDQLSLVLEWITRPEAEEVVERNAQHMARYHRNLYVEHFDKAKNPSTLFMLQFHFILNFISNFMYSHDIQLNPK